MAYRIDKSFSSTIDEVISDATRLLVEAAHPENVILFGSYARGGFTVDSDVDLLVVLPVAEDTFEEMMRLERVLLSLPIPVDVLVYSTNDVQERGHLRGTVLYHALSKERSCMTPHERALELLTLAREDEQAASLNRT